MEMEASEDTQREIDLAVRMLLADALEKAMAVLTARRGELDAGAALLLARETLGPEEFPPLQKHAASPVSQLDA
jgi:cell division protease FtsH